MFVGTEWRLNWEVWSNMGATFVRIHLGHKWDLCSNMGCMFVLTDLGIKRDLLVMTSEMREDALAPCCKAVYQKNMGTYF